ncbi:MAG: hypothetical protein RLW62_22815, partial [Gammaproteobacteria bacterium]
RRSSDLLEARIDELERLLAERRIAADEGQRLLAAYRAQRARFLDYQAELQAYLEAQEAEQFGDDFGDEFEDTFGDVIEAEETLEPLDDAAGEALDERDETADGTPEFAPLDDAPGADVPADFEEAVEEIEPFTPSVADEPALFDQPDFEDPAVDEPAFEAPDEGFDGFEELDEELEGFELNDVGAPAAAATLAAHVRIGADGAVEWHGEVVLPTLHRRF